MGRAFLLYTALIIRREGILICMVAAAKKCFAPCGLRGFPEIWGLDKFSGGEKRGGENPP